MSTALLGETLEGPRVRLEAASGHTYRIHRQGDGLEIGSLRLEDRGASLFVQSLCIERGHRGFGAGSGAAALLRQAVSRAGKWHTLQAWAPPDSGLAVYFWLRMGLRPRAGDGPNGGLLMEHDIR